MYPQMNLGLILGTISDKEKTLEYIYVYLSNTYSCVYQGDNGRHKNDIMPT